MGPRKAAARHTPTICVPGTVTAHPLRLHSTQSRCNTCALRELIKYTRRTHLKIVSVLNVLNEALGIFKKEVLFVHGL